MTVLVGNGPSVLKAKLGHVIDSADRVVRFNIYVLRPEIADYTGSKTDVWAVNEGYCDGELPAPQKRPPVTLIAVPWWKPTEGCIWQRLADRFENGVEIVDEAVARRMTALFPREKWPSTGLMAMAHYVEIDTVAVIGFDSFKAPAHHYADAGAFCGHHDPGVEHEFVERLIAERGVVRLS